uniref:Uncharacterized protein n=1 Tax=Arundo donax TaxID=35708 RepID=A0A0A8ZEV7_ARUDO
MRPVAPEFGQDGGPRAR